MGQLDGYERTFWFVVYIAVSLCAAASMQSVGLAGTCNLALECEVSCKSENGKVACPLTANPPLYIYPDKADAGYDPSFTTFKNSYWYNASQNFDNDFLAPSDLWSKCAGRSSVQTVLSDDIANNDTRVYVGDGIDFTCLHFFGADSKEDKLLCIPQKDVLACNPPPGAAFGDILLTALLTALITSPALFVVEKLLRFSANPDSTCATCKRIIAYPILAIISLLLFIFTFAGSFSVPNANAGSFFSTSVVAILIDIFKDGITTPLRYYILYNRKGKKPTTLRFQDAFPDYMFWDKKPYNHEEFLDLLELGMDESDRETDSDSEMKKTKPPVEPTPSEGDVPK